MVEIMTREATSCDLKELVRRREGLAGCCHLRAAMFVAPCCQATAVGGSRANAVLLACCCSGVSRCSVNVLCN